MVGGSKMGRGIGMQHRKSAAASVREESDRPLELKRVVTRLEEVVGKGGKASRIKVNVVRKVH